MPSIAENIARVRERIAEAARRARRDPDQIALMAVSKTFSADNIIEAFVSGIRLFGENRVQEFAEKREPLEQIISVGARFHLIGHLQSNKAARAAELFSAIDSVDSLALAGKLNSAAEKLGRVLPVLLEINIGREQAKSGLLPDSPELDELLRAAPKLDALHISGLMTIPPFTDDPEGARPYFCKLRELRDDIAALGLRGIGMQTLSMGMSHDFEVAIEEGSTCVRVGTAIFGERTQ